MGQSRSIPAIGRQERRDTPRPAETLERDPHDEAALLLMGNCLLSLRRYTDATEYFTRIVQSYAANRAVDSLQPKPGSPHLARAFNNLGVASKATGDFPAALDHYRMAQEIFGQFETDRAKRELACCLGNSGAVRLKQGEVRLALDDFSQAVSLLQAMADGPARSAGLASAIARRARCNYHRGAWTEAIADYRESIALLEGNPLTEESLRLRLRLARNYLNQGLTYANAGEDGEALASLLTSRERPRCCSDTVLGKHFLASVFHALGSLPALAGTAREAIGYLEAAVQLRRELVRLLGHAKARLELDQSLSNLAHLANAVWEE